MDNQDNLTVESKSRYRLRSSMKKSLKNSIGGLDVSDDGQDITFAPPPRRVSFAASSTVKPFLNDPEKNTIWDNTYEEEINNHTDSNNVISLESHSNIQETKSIITPANRPNVDFNQSVGNLESTLYNSSDSMELTNCVVPQVKGNSILDRYKIFQDNSFLHDKENCTQHQTIDMCLTGYGLNIADKENILMPTRHETVSKSNVQFNSQYQKKILKATKPFQNKTIIEPTDMELTCQFNTHQMSAKMVKGTHYEYEPMEVDETNKTLNVTKHINGTLCQEFDMSMTCNFVKPMIINNDNITTLKFESDKHFTGQSSNKAVHPNSTHYVADMELTCGFPQNTNKPQILVQKSEHNICSKPHTTATSTLELSNGNMSAVDMEFTCRFPQKDVILQSALRNNKTQKTNSTSLGQVLDVNQTSADMEFTCRIPGNLPKSMMHTQTHTSSDISQEKDLMCPPKLEQSPVDMEFTCRFPQNDMILQPTSRNGKSQKTNTTPLRQVLDVNQTAADMEFTCRIPDNPKESKMHKQSYTSDIPQEKDLICSPKLEQSAVDMEFTCRFPQNGLGLQKILTTENSSSQNTVFLGQQVTDVNQTTADMEFTCRIPDQPIRSEMPLPQVPNNIIRPENDRNYLPVLEQTAIDMEFTCRFPQNGKHNMSQQANVISYPQHLYGNQTNLELTGPNPEKSKSILIPNRMSNCDVPTNLNNMYSSKLVKPEHNPSTVDMEFTCRFSPQDLKFQELQTSKSLSQKVNTVSNPKLQQSHVNQTTVDITQSNLQQSHSNPTTEIELSGRFSGEMKKVQTLTQISNNEIPQHSNLKMEQSNQSTNDMEFTNRIPQNDTDMHIPTTMCISNLELSTSNQCVENMKSCRFRKTINEPLATQISNSIIAQKISSGVSLEGGQSNAKQPGAGQEFTGHFSQEDTSNIGTKGHTAEKNQTISKQNTSNTEELKRNFSDQYNCGIDHASSIISNKIVGIENNLTKINNERIRSALKTTDNGHCEGNQDMYFAKLSKNDRTLKNDNTDDENENDNMSQLKSKCQTENITCIGSRDKPTIRVREFGNIPIAIDCTDLSMDHKIDDVVSQDKISNISQNNHDTIYAVCMEQPVQHNSLDNKCIKDSLKSLKDAFHQHYDQSSHRNPLSDVEPIQSVAHKNPAPQEKTPEQVEVAKENYLFVDVKGAQPVEHTILDKTCIKDALKSVKDALYQYYDQSSNEYTLSDVESIHPVAHRNPASLAKTEEQVEVARDNSLFHDFEGAFALNKNETIVAEKCSLIDTLSSIDSEDLPNNTFDQVGTTTNNEKFQTPPKVIYSEPMNVTKPSTSIFNFSNGLSSNPSSSKKNFCLNSITSMDGTQQLIEATFSKAFSSLDASKNCTLQKNESGFAGMCRKSDLNDSCNSSTFRYQKLLNNIEQRIIQYQRPNTSGYEECCRLLREKQDTENKVRHHLDQVQPPKPRRSIIDLEVSKLCLSKSSNSEDTIDSSMDYPEEGEDKQVHPAQISKNLHERISDVFDSIEDHLLKLEHSDENYYIFSTFSQLAWFAVNLDSEDGSVKKINYCIGLKKNSRSIFAPVYRLIEKYIINKLQMDNLRSSLGSCFDMFSLLDHVQIIIERSFEFCTEFLHAQRVRKTTSNERTLKSRVFSPSSDEDEQTVIDPPRILKKKRLLAAANKCGFVDLKIIENALAGWLKRTAEWLKYTKKQYKSLKIEEDETVSFQILVNYPSVCWTVKFKLASVEHFQPDSLKALSKWGKVNEDQLKMILRNTEPGIDCIRRFVAGVVEYFKRIELSKYKIKDGK